MRRLCFALDLKDDPDSIAAYKRWHAPGGPPATVTHSIRAAGIESLEIYLCGNRLFMVMEVSAGFSLTAKAASDGADADVQAWERLMWTFQHESGYRATFEAFDKLIGFDRLKVCHLNDSKKPCGSRVDRHEHIGRGCLGLEPFRRLLNDGRFDHLPMILETEKSEWRDGGKIAIDPLDEMNLETLRSLRNTGT
jgi:L-rhamnose mutarotase